MAYLQQSHPPQPPEVLIQGVLEKKKRKALQGYAKRFFILDTNGTLSYSRSQGERPRDAVDISKASIGRSRKRRHLVIDTGDKVPWHCKALNEQDYERWTAAFHNFTQVHDANQKAGGTATAMAAAHARASRDDGVYSANAAGNVYGPPLAGQSPHEHLISDKTVSDLVRTISQMAQTIAQLERASRPALIPPRSPDLSNSGMGKLVSAVTTATSGLMGGSAADTLDTEQLADAIQTLKQQHKRVLDLLERAHVTSDTASIRSLQKAESIADSEYFDAEAGIAYDMDANDDGEASSSAETSESEDGGSTYHSDEDSSLTSSEDEDATTLDDAASTGSNETTHGAGHVERRTKLPHPVAGEEVSLFGLLKKNMGKDLSKISFPVTLNEPLSALQAMAETLEYLDLLDAAGRSKDSMERLLYVTTFAISTYSTVKYRGSRKPFNPLLGETYELVRPEKGLRFVAEKVVHHPNWTAAYAQGRGWDFTATASGAQKFWGRSYELLPEGINEVRLKDSGELFSWSKPPSYIRNIMSGEKYIEHVGEMEVVNHETGERAVVTFKEGSSWGGSSSRNKVEGKLYDANGSVHTEITGRWDDSISRKTGHKTSETIWQIHDFPSDAPKYYGFSEWAIQLNEITPDIKEYLPPTDSRLRPDQRALEEGDVDAAEHGKQTLEQKQRERRKKWEGAPKDAKPPQFFAPGEGTGQWHYKGDYWERREKKQWKKEIQIFEME